MDLYTYLNSKSIRELQNLYVYATDYQKSLIKKCIEEKTILNKNEYYSNTNYQFYDNLSKFGEIINTDDSNNKFQERLNIDLKDLKNKKNTNNSDNSLGKRKNF